jgi:hypothetical protein
MNTVAAARVRTVRSARADMIRRLVAGGGRFSTTLGIDVEAGDAEIDRWFLAATLFGARIPTTIAERTFHVLAAPALEPRAQSCAGHLGLVDEYTSDPLGRMRSLAAAGGVDVRDLEGALVRTALAHRGGLGPCPGGRDCVALVHPAPPPPAPVSASVRP